MCVCVGMYVCMYSFCMYVCTHICMYVHHYVCMYILLSRSIKLRDDSIHDDSIHDDSIVLFS